MSDVISREAAIGALEERQSRYRRETATWTQIQMDILALRALPAAQPAHFTNCAICRRVVDTREESEGGDPHGCQYGDQWVCSGECGDKLSPPPDWLEDAAQPAPDMKPLAFLVTDFCIGKHPSKARGNFPDPVEYIYPASRENDARATANMMRGTLTPLYSAAQPAPVTVEEAARVLLADLNRVKPVGMWGDAWPEINKKEGYAWNRMAAALRALAGDKP